MEWGLCLLRLWMWILMDVEPQPWGWMIVEGLCTLLMPVLLALV